MRKIIVCLFIIIVMSSLISCNKRNNNVDGKDKSNAEDVNNQKEGEKDDLPTDKKDNKKETHESMISHILGIDNLNLDILSYNTYSYGTTYDNMTIVNEIETIFCINGNDLKKIKKILDENYSSYCLYKDRTKFPKSFEYGLNATVEIDKNYLEEQGLNEEAIIKIMGEEAYQEFFKNGFIKSDDEIDYTALKKYVYDKFKEINSDEESKLENFFELYEKQYDMRTYFCEKVGADIYNKNRHFELSNEDIINNDFYDKNANHKMCTIYYFENNEKISVYMDYIECCDKTDSYDNDDVLSEIRDN